MTHNSTSQQIGRGMIDIQGLRCQEASPLSKENYIPCGAVATAIIWHERDGRAYLMCPSCADHNVRNRGAQLLAAIDER
mgnify:CR=1 FL=1